MKCSLGSKNLNSSLRWSLAPALALLVACGGGTTNDPKDDVGTVVTTESYSVKYVPDTQGNGTVAGKSQFTLTISDLDGNSESGLEVEIEPTMAMDSGSFHRTAYNQQCTEGEAAEYHCTIYYVMPSVSMTGMSMGSWSVKVMITSDTNDMETATFNPTVAMQMGDTLLVKLNGVVDKIPQGGDMSNAEPRKYFLFNDFFENTASGYGFGLYIAAKESGMSFPPVSSDSTFNADSMHHKLEITTVSVEVSVDGMNWDTAIEQEMAGYWKVSSEEVLTAVPTTLYVKFVVNDEQKTTDGSEVNTLSLSDDENNNFAKFTVTPSNFQ